MTAKTSCNKSRFWAFLCGLMRKNLSLAGLILGIGFVCMPLQYLLGAFSYNELDPAYSMSGVFGLGGLFTCTSIYLVPLLWVAAAAVVGLSQTAYMQNRRAVDVYHSLPLTRKQLLCAHYMAAFFTVALPMALNYGATLLLSAVRQMRFPTAEFAPGAAGFGLALWLVSLAGMLSVAFLVSTQTGSVFDTLIFAGVLLCAPLFLFLVHEMMCNEFLYGHVTGLPLIVVARFSPLTLGLTDFATVLFLGTDSAVQLPWWLCPLWAVLSAAILAAACALYVRRPSERAEAPSRTGLLALIIRVLAMLILCPTGGYVFACSIRSVPTLGMLLLGTAVCGIFGFFILETILNRGAKGLFKAFPLGLALTAVVTGYMAAMCTGGLGYESRQPAADTIADVIVNFRGQFDYVDRYVYTSHNTTSYLYGNVTLQSPEAIQAVLQLQADAVAEHRASGQLLANSYNNSNYPDIGRQTLSITYTLKNGKCIQRDYGVWLTPVIVQDYIALSDCAEMDAACSPLLNIRDADYSLIRAAGAFSLANETISDPDAIARILDALRSDTGRLGLTGRLDEHARVLATLELWPPQFQSGTPYGTEFQSTYTVQVTESFPDTIAALRALGLGAIVSTEPPALSRVWLCESDYFCYCSSQLNTVFSDWFDQNTLHSFIDADDRNGYRADFPLALSADECDLQSLFSLGRLRTKKHDDYMIWMIFEAEDGTLSLPRCVSEKALQAAGYGDLPGRIEQLQV